MDKSHSIPPCLRGGSPPSSIQIEVKSERPVASQLPRKSWAEYAQGRRAASVVRPTWPSHIPSAGRCWSSLEGAAHRLELHACVATQRGVTSLPTIQIESGEGYTRHEYNRALWPALPSQRTGRCADYIRRFPLDLASKTRAIWCIMRVDK
jgi:hypothetical protein